MPHTTRKVTCALIEAAENGILTWEHIARACMCYMSEDDVADMAHREEMTQFLETDEEDDNPLR